MENNLCSKHHLPSPNLWSCIDLISGTHYDNISSQQVLYVCVWLNQEEPVFLVTVQTQQGHYAFGYLVVHRLFSCLHAAATSPIMHDLSMASLSGLLGSRRCEAAAEDHYFWTEVLVSGTLHQELPLPIGCSTAPIPLPVELIAFCQWRAGTEV